MMLPTSGLGHLTAIHSTRKKRGKAGLTTLIVPNLENAQGLFVQKSIDFINFDHLAKVIQAFNVWLKEFLFVFNNK
jgi:hypothetical protein